MTGNTINIENSFSLPTLPGQHIVEHLPEIRFSYSQYIPDIIVAGLGCGFGINELLSLPIQEQYLALGVQGDYTFLNIFQYISLVVSPCVSNYFFRYIYQIGFNFFRIGI